MIIAQNKLATSTFNDDIKLLISVYKGRVNIDLALEHLANVVEFYLTNSVKGSVADLHQLLGSYAKVFDYLVEAYYPAAVKSGLKIQAYVVSQDLINENLGFRLDDLASRFGIKSAVFTSRKEAENWVKEFLKTQ
ncbi:MAG: hypothetical protein KDC79_08955 [Cyclobacteriaceae bacterium]|nr:hypothetical protein [Cyclobacteriaceae bacterium]